MVLRPTKAPTNGSAARRYPSWIEGFVQYTGRFIESADIFRRWTAISAVAALLERKVWVDTGNLLYPNMYIWLVGPAGIGKTNAIKNCISILREIDGPYKPAFSATSVSRAALTDLLAAAKRVVTVPKSEVYNSLYVAVDELSAFMSSWDADIVAALTTFYDNVWYSEAKRGDTIRHHIDNPQLNVICGATPDGLLKIVPSVSWGQGLMGRVVLIYSDQRHHKDMFGREKLEEEHDKLLSDATRIASDYMGPLRADNAYRQALDEWRLGGMRPAPNHPLLRDYTARRATHIVKLSIISAIDQDRMTLTLADFTRAREWMQEADSAMPKIFTTGGQSDDAMALDQIAAYVADRGTVSRGQLLRFVSSKVPLYNVERAIDMLLQGERITAKAIDGDGRAIRFGVSEPGDVPNP